ncbi:MAG: hypothetical protein AAGC54_09360 [Cyanobacteria bacterium P01_F01_bin.4]
MRTNIDFYDESFDSVVRGFESSEYAEIRRRGDVTIGGLRAKRLWAATPDAGAIFTVVEYSSDQTVIIGSFYGDTSWEEVIQDIHWSFRRLEAISTTGNSSILLPGRYARARYNINVFQHGERFCYQGISQNGSTIASVTASPSDPGVYFINGFDREASLSQINSTTLRFAQQEFERIGAVNSFSQLGTSVRACLTSNEPYSNQADD